MVTKLNVNTAAILMNIFTVIQKKDFNLYKERECKNKILYFRFLVNQCHVLISVLEMKISIYYDNKSDNNTSV